jgi:hypothetical protein
MKFNCDKVTPADHITRTNALAKVYDQRVKDAQEWHRMFAWFPVVVADNDCRWLEYVERRVSPMFAEEPKHHWITTASKAHYANMDYFESSFWIVTDPDIEYRAIPR